MESFLLPLLILGAMLFFMSRQQKKVRDAQAQLQSSLKPGVSVVTIGGLHGVVDSIDEAAKTVTLDVEGVFLTFDAQAIRSVTSDNAAATPNNITNDEDKA